MTAPAHADTEAVGPGNRFSSVACPSCGHGLTKTVSTRSFTKDYGRGYRRVRACCKCTKTFPTYEISASEHKLLVAIKKTVADHTSKEVEEENTG